ncbi:MAG: glycosyltransferase family 2 protein [Erythrobacter sp.]
MRLSLVICTRNRADRLPECLAALDALSSKGNFQLVLVDNGSTDSTRTVLDAYEADFEIETVSEPTPGLARARNAGWRASSGEVVVFTDDDCYVEPEFVEHIVQLFAQHPEIGFFGGRVLLHNPLDYPITIKEDLAEEYFPPFRFIEAGKIHGANFGFRREVLEKLGGFDNRLGAGTPFPCEDIEMVGRAVASGWAGMYSPIPTVRHDHGRRTATEVSMLIQGYDIGGGAYYISMLKQKTIRRQTVRHFISRSMALTPRKCFRRLKRTMRQLTGAMRFLLST